MSHAQIICYAHDSVLNHKSTSDLTNPFLQTLTCRMSSCSMDECKEDVGANLAGEQESEKNENLSAPHVNFTFRLYREK